MITLWDTNAPAHVPRKINTNGLRALVERALRTEGLRKKLDMKMIRRHEFKTNHGFRKFFQTNCEPKMKSLDVMTLMGQDTGLAASYNKPTVDMLLTEYLKAVDNLTINKDSQQQTEIIRNQQMLAVEIQAKAQRIESLEDEIKSMRGDMKNISNDQEIRALREQNQILSKQLADVIEQQQQHANTFDMKFVKLLDIVKTGLVDQDEATRSFISGEIAKMMPRKLTTKELQKIESRRNLTGVFIDSTPD
jgi:uncharacterized protein (UPF0335 family)